MRFFKEKKTRMVSVRLRDSDFKFMKEHNLSSTRLIEENLRKKKKLIKLKKRKGGNK
jgi:hypothetical protein